MLGSTWSEAFQRGGQFPAEVGGPVVHEPAPAVEQVRAPIGRLGRVQMV